MASGTRVLTPTPPNPEVRLQERLADFERRLADAERRANEASVRTGQITATAGNTADSGFLLCNGQAVSRTTYAALFDRIGTIWGAGNGSTTFNVPNLNDGKFPRGAGASGGYGGADSHVHGMSHSHPFSGTTTDQTLAEIDVAFGTGSLASNPFHEHLYSGTTGQSSAANTGSASSLPPYANVLFQIKI